MPKQWNAFDAVRDADLKLPEFADKKSANAWYCQELNLRSERLKALSTADNGPAVRSTFDSLRQLEVWAESLYPKDVRRLGTSREELDSLLYLHMARVAARQVEHAKLAVERSLFVPSRWKLSLSHGLMTVELALDRDGPASLPWRTRVPTETPLADWAASLRERARNDATLHPAVIASKKRLSPDCAMQHCQILTLARGTDAFSEADLVSRVAAGPADDRELAVRCLEALPMLSDKAISMVRGLAKSKTFPANIAVPVVIRHRPALGLALAAEVAPMLGPYDYNLIVDALESHPDLDATALYAHIVVLISEKKHALWQAGRAFAPAMHRVWSAARAGNEEALDALWIVARRWKRIPPETLLIMQRLTPGLTPAAIAKMRPRRT